MTKKLYDLAVKTGEYTNREGETKGKWQNIGACLEADDGGKFIVMERWFNPAGLPNPENRGNIMVSMFKPQKRDNQQSPPPQTAGGGGGSTEDFDDDIPFITRHGTY